MIRPTALLSSFKSVLRRHERHPDGIPFYLDMTKRWLVRDGERWWLLDAAGQDLRRVATIAATYITGVHRPDFVPGMMAGDHVVVVNVKDAVMVGDGWLRTPITWQTCYPSGKYRVRLTDMYDRDPCMVMWYFTQQAVSKHFVRRLKTRCAPMEKLWLYEDAVHPHQDRNPRPLVWNEVNRRIGTRYRDKDLVLRWKPNQFIQ